MPLAAIREANLGGVTVRCHMDGDVVDLSRRLAEGDPTITHNGKPWLGDPSLTLHLGVPVDVFGRPTGQPSMYEVWGIDAHSTPYLVIRWPRCDASLLRELIKGDPRISDLIADIETANAKRDADVASEQSARNEEVADKLHFALRRDQGQHFGGLTKRIY